MTLAQIQERFYALATREPGVELALAEALVPAAGTLSGADRVGIYADMYLWRQIDALRADFPKLVALVGDGAFYRLAEAYVAAHPSRHPDLGQLGRGLPAFLREHPSLALRPDAADLAALEWARGEVFFEAAAAPVSRAALAGLPPEAIASSRLRMVPALRLLRFDHDAAALWRRLEDGAAPGEAAPVRAAAAVWRPELEAAHCALAADEAEALSRALSGGELDSVCAAFSERENPVEAAFTALASWLDEGWVERIELPRG